MKKKPKSNATDQDRAGSLSAAAGMLGVSKQWISKCKAAGVKAFTANGTVDLGPVREWLEANRETLVATIDTLNLKDQKLTEETLRLRIKRHREEGAVVDVAWVNERIHRLAGDFNALRSRMEGEAPVTLAACGGDVAQVRTAFKGIMDGFWKEFRTFAKHFEK